MLKMSRRTKHLHVRARQLPGLAELYELNYIQLRRLVADFDIIPDITVSCADNALDLHLKILDRARFTTTACLTYRFSDKSGAFPAPDAVVRLYHDAQAAEVISHSRRRGRQHAEYDRFYHHYPMQMKWEANRFLQKWLAYCLLQGHGFSPGREHFSEAVQAVATEKVLDVES